MAKQLNKEQLQSLARLGAATRLAQLKEEIAAIETLIGRRGDMGPRKRRLSPEARKRISDAQKRRWAKARASK